MELFSGIANTLVAWKCKKPGHPGIDLILLEYSGVSTTSDNGFFEFGGNSRGNYCLEKQQILSGNSMALDISFNRNHYQKYDTLNTILELIALAN